MNFLEGFIFLCVYYCFCRVDLCSYVLWTLKVTQHKSQWTFFIFLSHFEPLSFCKVNLYISFIYSKWKNRTTAEQNGQKTNQNAEYVQNYRVNKRSILNWLHAPSHFQFLLYFKASCNTAQLFCMNFVKEKLEIFTQSLVKYYGK